jgi:hypothetical protein
MHSYIPPIEDYRFLLGKVLDFECVKRWATPPCTTHSLGVLSDPFENIHMGVTAENVARGTGSPARIRTLSPLRASRGQRMLSSKAFHRTDRPC